MVMRTFLLIAVLSVVLSTSGASLPAAFGNWPEGADPKAVGNRVVAQLLTTEPEQYVVRGCDGDKYGGGKYVSYPVTSLWMNSLEFARLTGDQGLLRRLTDLFEPFYPGGAKADKVTKPRHVDFNVFGAVPLEIAILTGDSRARRMGLRYADDQWEPPRDGDFDLLPHWIKPRAIPVEKQLEYFRNGYTIQTRLWIDDMYMINVLQTQAYRLTGDMKYIRRAAKEMVLYLDRLQLENGLFNHAADVPFRWARGNGWMAAGMPMILQYLKPGDEHYDRILRDYRRMMKTLLAFQRENGLWGQLVDDPKSWDETSGSLMFAYGFIMGCRHGWLDADVFAPAARKAYLAVVSRLDEYGNVPDVCIGTGARNDLQYYYDRRRINGDPHGQAPLMWCINQFLDWKSESLPDAHVATSVGDVRLSCPKPEGWTFGMTSRSDGTGVDVVTVTMSRESAAPPPEFSVRWFAPQTDVHHLWTSASTHYGIPWSEPMASELSSSMPLYAFLDANDRNRFTFACSESCRKVVFRSPVSETKMGFSCSFGFFAVPEAPLDRYEVEIRLDTRPLFYAETIGSAADWMCRASGAEPLAAPDCAFDALYSTWYDFHQDVSAAAVERECALAAGLGMKTVIVDDGWQIDLPLGNRPWNGYRLCGDWEPGRHFPDMAAHVKRVQGMGFRYMMWYAVPFVGKDSRNFGRFKGKYLPVECAGGHVLDPRFPEVREFIVRTYEDAVRNWNIDGLKLDFIGRFALKEGVVDPAVAENYAGRDIKAIPLAVEALLAEVVKRLKALKPDFLIEFRQPYVGPSIRRFGNMLRATDCPLSMVENRTRIARLRLTSGKTAVHSDMLEWRNDETAESAARCILNSLFGVVQYSVRLDAIPESHRRMLAHWIGFAEEHREALVKGTFRPHHPASDYPLLEGESAAERIFGVYQENLVVDVGAADRPVVVLNGANVDRLLLVLPATPEKVEAFDTFGNRVTGPALKAGVNSAAVPVSGYLKITWKAGEGKKPIRFMTFNIYGSGYGGGFEAVEREDRAIATVRKAAPDLISWQEVNAGWWKSKLFTTMDEFETIRGDEDEALVRAGADLAQRKGNWVNHEPLMYRRSRFTLLDSGLDFYHLSLQYEKSLTWAVLEDKTDGRRLIAFATHYWWQTNGEESDAIRELNTRHVLGRIETIRAKWGDLPVVGGGDLNCQTGHIALNTYERNGYADAGCVAPIRSTVPSEHGAIVRDAEGKCRGRIGRIGEKGHAMLDHVFFSKDRFRALKHDVVTDRDTLDISDHSPVVVDLVLK